MSNFDLGQGVANIGNIWAGKVAQDTELQRQQEQQALALAKLRLDQDAQAQQHAHQLFLQHMAEQQEKSKSQDEAYKEIQQFPGLRLNEAQMTDLGAEPGSARRATFKQVGNPNDLAGTSLAGAVKAPTLASGSASSAGVGGVVQPSAGSITKSDNAPGFEVQEPFAEKIKRQQLDQAMQIQTLKDARDRDIAAAKDETERKKIDLMYAHTMAVLQSTQANQGVNHSLALQKSYEATSKPLEDAISAYARMKQVAPTLLDPNSPLENRAAAEAAIFEGNQKIVNPGVSVRAQQSKLYTDHQSLSQRFQAMLQNWTKGGQLAPDTVKAFMDSADRTIQPALQAYGANRDRYTKQAKATQGVDSDFVVGPDLRDNLNTAPPAAAAAPHIPTYNPKTGKIE